MSGDSVHCSMRATILVVLAIGMTTAPRRRIGAGVANGESSAHVRQGRGPHLPGEMRGLSSSRTTSGRCRS